MTRINTNIPAVVASRQLNRSTRGLQTSLERLSTGLRINRGADDPAGLIVSQNLRSEIESVRQAVTNSQRASNVIATTEGALDEVASLLNDIQSKIIEAANEGAISDDEIAANQLEIDDAIGAITRIANTTTFSGRKLLNGSLGYITSGVVPAELTDLKINRTQFGTKSFVPVNVEIVQSAQHAELQFRASSIASSVTLEIAGPDGVDAITLQAGQNITQIRDAINLKNTATGVSATFINSGNPNSGISITSGDFGSKAFVQIQEIGTITQPFVSFVTDSLGNMVQRDEGRDVVATINGAGSLGDGLNLSLNSSTLAIEVRIQETLNTVGAMSSFSITGGGARFQLGPGVDPNQQVNIGVQSVAATRLGLETVGFLSEITGDGQYALIKNDPNNARIAGEIIAEAIRQVSVLRGRLGAFEKNTLDTNINQLSITLENLMAAEASIRDLDFAQETSVLTKNQILVSAGTSVLAIANQTPQTVLSLLQ